MAERHLLSADANNVQKCYSLIRYNFIQKFRLSFQVLDIEPLLGEDYRLYRIDRTARGVIEVERRRRGDDRIMR